MTGLIHIYEIMSENNKKKNTFVKNPSQHLNILDFKDKILKENHLNQKSTT